VSGQERRLGDSVFARLRIGIPPDGSRTATTSTVLAGVSEPPRVWSRLQQLEVIAGTWPALRLIVPSMTFVSVTGTARREYFLRAWVETSTASEGEAIAAAAEWAIDRDAWSLRSPSESGPCVFYLDIEGPADRTVTVQGAHAAVDVFGMNSSVRIATEHGRVSVLGSSGDIDVRGARHIVWAGAGGRLHLASSGDIDLRFTRSAFEGDCEAIAEQSIRVWAPTRFDAALEASVAASDRFKGASASRWVRDHDERQGVVFRSGSGAPSVRLASRAGTILMDSAD
jgi:hypothetical protein